MPNYVEWPKAHLLFTEQQVYAAIDQQAQSINSALGNEPLVALCIMHGGLVYAGHLLPKLKMPVVFDALRVTRYRDSTKGGDTIDWITQPQVSLQDQQVLLMDDIFDEGETLEYLHGWALMQGATKVHSAVMVNKLHRRKPSQYRVGFSAQDVPDEYVFGMGMDYQGAWRNASGIWALD